MRRVFLSHEAASSVLADGDGWGRGGKGGGEEGKRNGLLEELDFVFVLIIRTSLPVCFLGSCFAKEILFLLEEASFEVFGQFRVKVEDEIRKEREETSLVKGSNKQKL